jgi:hypothetical protein
MSLHPNSGQDHNIRISNESFGNVANFKHMGTTLTNQNDIHDEIDSRLNSGNACYHSVQKICLPISYEKNKIKICRTVILPLVLYGCGTWSHTLREVHRLRVFENRVLRRTFGPKREEDCSWRKLDSSKLHSLYSSPNTVRVIKSSRIMWAGHMTRIGEGRGVCVISVGRPERKRPLGRPRHRWENKIKWTLWRQESTGRTGFNWLKIGSVGGLLWTR